MLGGSTDFRAAVQSHLPLRHHGRASRCLAHASLHLSPSPGQTSQRDISALRLVASETILADLGASSSSLLGDGSASKANTQIFSCDAVKAHVNVVPGLCQRRVAGHQRPLRKIQLEALQGLAMADIR